MMKRGEFIIFCNRLAVVLDGATGTELIKQGMPAGVCPELWVLEHPESITAVQQAYAAAGSHIVYTPTFGGNAIKLAEFGLADRAFEINKKLAEISCDAVHHLGVKVFGDMAPTGKFVEPSGDWSFEEAVKVYKAQAEALAAGGVDGFVIETMMDLQEARAALIAVRETFPTAPVMVTMTFDTSQRTLTGVTPEAALITLQSLGADAFGCNCSTGPADMAKVIKTLSPIAEIPLIAKPNAGLPILKDGKTVFNMDAKMFADNIEPLLAAGANLIGGGIVVCIGCALIGHYLSFAIFYDADTFIQTGFGRKSPVHRFDHIRYQKLYMIQGGSIVVELHMADGSHFQVHTGMTGMYPFMDHAFQAWLLQTGRKQENCSWYDPDNSCWFPPFEG